MRKTIIGVMGPGSGATSADRQNAYELGRLVAQQHWVLLTGGRNVGVMDAASRGAKQENGITVGILPTEHDQGLSEAIDIPIFTGMGSARNNINVLSSDVVVVCGMGTGTASEVALAMKANKKVILLNPDRESQTFFTSLSDGQLFVAETPKAAIEIIRETITTNHI